MVSDPIIVGVANGVVLVVGASAAKRILLLTVPVGASTLRLVGGFTLATLVGWLAGGLLSALSYTLLRPVLQYSVSADSLLLPLIGRCFWFAVFGAGYGVHALKKLGNSPIADVQDTSQIGGELHATKAQEFHPPFVDTKPEPPTEKSAAAAPKVFTFRNEHENTTPKPHPTKPPIGKSTSVPHAPPVGHVPDEAFAEAMAEIEESRTVKGLWARCYAESDGDDAKAKASYLKARALVLADELSRQAFAEKEERQKAVLFAQQQSFAEQQENRRASELAGLLKRVKAGDLNSMFTLGQMYHIGSELVQPNAEKAVELISSAAFLGNTAAQSFLSLMYWNGDGVQLSKCDALAWSRCAGVNDATYWKRVTQWMTLIDSSEITESDEIVASIVAVKDNPNSLEGAIAALKARNLSLEKAPSAS